MQGDAAEEESTGVDLAVAVAAQQGRKIVDRYEAAQRIGDIRIDAWTAVQHCAPERAVEEQVAEIDLPQHRVPRQEEVEAHQQAAGPGDTLNLGYGFFQAREVAQSVSDEDAIEGLVAERKRHRVGADRFLDAARAGQAQHPVCEVGSDGYGRRTAL